MAARAAHTGHVPGVDNRALRRREKAASQHERTVCITPSLVAVGDVEIAQHPRTFPTTATERPSATHDIAALDFAGVATARHRRARDDPVGSPIEERVP